MGILSIIIIANGCVLLFNYITITKFFRAGALICAHIN